MTDRARARGLRAGAVALAAALVLTGCAGDTRDDLRSAVADLTADANAGDAAALRSGVDAFLALVDRAVRDREIDTAEGVRLAEIAQRLRTGADVLEAPEPTPEPTTESPSPEPTTESPSPEPTPAEDEDDEQEEEEPTPDPTTPPPTSAAPSPTPSPSAPTVVPDLSPAAATTPEPSPTA
jgi:outer membrane biosynthesis protein TonB